MQQNGVFLFGISVFVLKISTFLHYANYESDDVVNCATKMVNILLNQEYLLKYWSNNLETWHQKCTSRKKQNETYGNSLGPSFFLSKSKYPDLQPL